jgi:hypothetical protein
LVGIHSSRSGGHWTALSISGRVWHCARKRQVGGGGVRFDRKVVLPSMGGQVVQTFVSRRYGSSSAWAATHGRAVRPLCNHDRLLGREEGSNNFIAMRPDSASCPSPLSHAELDCQLPCALVILEQKSRVVAEPHGKILIWGLPRGCRSDRRTEPVLISRLLSMYRVRKGNVLHKGAHRGKFVRARTVASF